MTSPRWNPIHLPFRQSPLSRLDEQIDRAFDSLLTTPWLAEAAAWTPQIDVYETPDVFLIEADLPGVKPEDLQVRVEDDTVTICGSRSESQREETPHGVVRIERRHGAFCRTLPLSQPVDAQHIQISQQQGVFLIRLPKTSAEDTP